MKIHDYVNCDGVALGQLLSDGAVSASEVRECAIDAIEKLNGQLNAVTIHNFDNARALNIVPGTSSLAGVPFLLKDVNVFTNDMPTTFSSAFFADAKPRPDSEIVQRWRSAGLVVLGKTNTPEFAEDYVCEPTYRGATLNPWHAGLTTGGSSGGAGAAVASGMVPIAHGTDLGGSIRIPAACCGVYGLKPTTGMSPVDASLPEIANGFNSDHVLTRSVRDSAASLDITAGYFAGYRYRVEPQVDSFLQCLDKPCPSLQIGFSYHTPTGEPVPERQRRAVEKVATHLQDFGHQLTEYRYPNDLEMGAWMETLWMLDVAYEIDQRIAETGREPEPQEMEALTHFLRRHIASMSAMDLYKARRQAHLNSVSLMQSMANVDLLLTPALGSDPISLGALDSRTSAFDYESWAGDGYRFAPFSYVCNMTGQPAASLPIPLDDTEMPCAVQLAGHHCKDHLILKVSAQLEKVLQWQSQRPPVWAGH
ncbi:MAG: amidase [Pseudomonadota bacterium]